jgi:hypothetical protein
MSHSFEEKQDSLGLRDLFNALRRQQGMAHQIHASPSLNSAQIASIAEALKPYAAAAVVVNR